ncbi:MAG: hypothetical protein OEX04_20570, partial [Acidimicrobiia bacterium]|nr:hypothetical protein [Acidimicrobiia bacterium]
MFFMPGAEGQIYGSPDRQKAAAVEAHGLSELLHAYARLGVGHVQLVIDPITTESIEALGKVIADM